MKRFFVFTLGLCLFSVAFAASAETHRYYLRKIFSGYTGVQPLEIKISHNSSEVFSKVLPANTVIFDHTIHNTNENTVITVSMSQKDGCQKVEKRPVLLSKNNDDKFYLSFIEQQNHGKECELIFWYYSRKGEKIAV